MRHIILSGPTNSGKSTQAWLLKEYFKDSHEVIDVGQLLRERSEIQDKTGRILSEAIKKGVGAPSDMVVSILKERVRYLISSQKFCIFAFSRLRPEVAVTLSENLLPSSAIFISLENLSPELILIRGASRLIDHNTGIVYRKEDISTLSEELQERLKSRDDDKSELLLRKLNDYVSTMELHMDVWEKAGYRVIRIDASKTIEQVFKEIVAQTE